MERTIGRKAYFGADCIISSLGFGTRENLDGVERYQTNLSSWVDGTSVVMTGETPIAVVGETHVAVKDGIAVVMTGETHVAAKDGIAVVMTGEMHVAAKDGIAVVMTGETTVGATGETHVAAKDGTPVAAIDCQRLKEEVSRKSLGKYTKVEQLSILALSEVLENSGVSFTDKRALFIFSTTKGNIDHITDPELRNLTNTARRIVSHFGGVNEPKIVSNACVSGVYAIIIAARLIECGEYDNVFVVGVDILTDFVISGFNAFKSITPEVCRPFDSSRDGLTLGEACGAVLITSIKGDMEVAGGGISNDANHISGPSRTGDGLHYAIEAALADSGVEKNELAFVNAHGTATPYNDEMESKALNLSGLTTTPCNSLKPYLGHTLGAAGVVETIMCSHALRDGVVYGLKGYSVNGVPYELNVSAEHRVSKGDACLKTASGFGGSNAALVLRKADDKERLHVCVDKEIVEVASVKMSDSDPQSQGISFAERIRTEFKSLESPNMKFYKMDELCKLGYVAAERLFKGVNLGYPSNRIAIIIANRNSSLDSDLKHQAIIDSKPDEGASPAVFVYTLANIVAGEIAIRHKIQGECTFFIEADKNSNFTAEYARFLLRSGYADAVIHGWCDLLGEKFDVDLKLIKH